MPTSRRAALAAVLLAGAIACDSRNAADLDGVQIPPLARDTFHPVEGIAGRGAEGGDPFLDPARSDHSQTLLPNGLVLIAGGMSGGSALDSARIYDQRSAGFFATGSMRIPRSGHTATATRAGDVVVAGGVDGAGEPVAAVEVYRAGMGTWTLAQPMSVARFGHSATALSSGDILIAGGITSRYGEITDSTEILDVDTLRFADGTPIGARAGQGVGRPLAFHTATPIPRDAAPPLDDDEVECAPGNREEVVLFAGGLTGIPGSVAAATASTVSIYFPLETTEGPSGNPRPGAWRDLVVGGGTAPAIRWAHAAHAVFCDLTPDDPAIPPSVTVVLVGGLGSFVPPLGKLASPVAGGSAVRDSATPALSYAALQIDVTTLRPSSLPRGSFLDIQPGVKSRCLGDPFLCPPFVGGAGARSVFHAGLGAVLVLGGNTFDPVAVARTPYSAAALLIDVRYDPAAMALVFTEFPSGDSMDMPRSFAALSLLAGPDLEIGTPDDTALVTGGQPSSTSALPTGEEYSFP